MSLPTYPLDSMLILLQAVGVVSVGFGLLRLTPQERTTAQQCRQVLVRRPHPAWGCALAFILDATWLWMAQSGLLLLATGIILASAWTSDKAVSRHLDWEQRRRALEAGQWKARIPAEQMQIRRAHWQRDELAQVEAQTLRHLMDPHFLFNALNGVMQRFLQDDPTAAQRHLSAFRRLLVQQNQATQDGWWTVEEEWDVLRDYVALELDRIAATIDVTLSTLDPCLSKAQIPAWMAQPLVENALWHGLLGDESECGWDRKLSIEAVPIAPDRIKIEVRNSRDPNAASPTAVPHMPTSPRRRHASDLIRHRLRLLGHEYHGQLSLTHTDMETVATLLLPVRETLWRTPGVNPLS
ncbi:MAG: hypothetical protein CMC97_02750 [Flavobacteriales bacterium]|nr:hypothetical protein [Flavobacteriales bacterium]